jgi:hypothetical protein
MTSSHRSSARKPPTAARASRTDAMTKDERPTLPHAPSTREVPIRSSPPPLGDSVRRDALACPNHDSGPLRE